MNINDDQARSIQVGLDQRGVNLGSWTIKQVVNTAITLGVVKPAIYPCGVCEEEFPTEEDRIGHAMRTGHDQESAR